MVTTLTFPQSKPFFKTEEEYQRFRDNFIKDVAPKMKKWQIARMRSEQAARNRIVN